MPRLFSKGLPWFLRGFLTASSVLAGVLVASAFSFAPAQSAHPGSPVAAAVSDTLPDAHAAQLRALSASKAHLAHLNHLGHQQVVAQQAHLAVIQARARKIVQRKPKPETSTSSTVDVASAPVSYAAGVLTASQVGQLWLSAGGPGWAESRAVEIASCESGFNPRAYNPSGATGLWQILGSVIPGDLTNPSVNAANAVAKFRASGDTFAQWVCQ